LRRGEGVSVILHHGDMREVLARLVAEGVRVQSVVTDPPYHLTSIVKRFGGEGAAAAKAGAKANHTGAYARASRGFMGKQWDGGDIAFQAETWRLCWDLLPPGGHLVAFSGTRTYHRMACAIEDAGFEIRDMLVDLVASDAAVATFMASLNDEQRSAFLRCIAESGFGGMLAWLYGSGFPKSHNLDGAWDGWGTALKPALEPICFARKPLEGTVAATVAKYGTGAINIDACRVGNDGGTKGCDAGPSKGILGNGLNGTFGQPVPGLGRWPANVVHDGSDEVRGAFPLAGGQLRPVTGVERAHRTVNAYGTFNGSREGQVPRGDTGRADRFFYSSKADADDRLGSKHPTVKPVDLIRWLVRLVTPPRGTVLDPFAGSGTTGMACMAEGFDCVLVEREAEYAADIRRRIAHVGGADTPLFAATGGGA
jgi:site-specific DNA-methyltransferase (adenine-specific)